MNKEMIMKKEINKEKGDVNMNLNFINKNNEVNSNLDFGLPWCRTQKNSEDEDCCGFINNSREKECASCEIDESMVDELINDLIDCMCEVISFVMKLIKNKERKQIERKEKQENNIEVENEVNIESLVEKLFDVVIDFVFSIWKGDARCLFSKISKYLSEKYGLTPEEMINIVKKHDKEEKEGEKQ